jgi:hypothetical protein
MDHWTKMRQLLGDHTVMIHRVHDPEEPLAVELHKFVHQPIYERCPCGFIYAVSKD